MSGANEPSNAPPRAGIFTTFLFLAMDFRHFKDVPRRFRDADFLERRAAGGKGRFPVRLEAAEDLASQIFRGGNRDAKFRYFLVQVAVIERTQHMLLDEAIEHRGIDRAPRQGI